MMARDGHRISTHPRREQVGTEFLVRHTDWGVGAIHDRQPVLPRTRRLSRVMEKTHRERQLARPELAREPPRPPRRRPTMLGQLMTSTRNRAAAMRPNVHYRNLRPSTDNITTSQVTDEVEILAEP